MSDAYDFTTLGIAPAPWKWVKAHDYADHHVLSAANGEVVHTDGSAGGEYTPDIIVDSPHGRAIAAAPALLRYAMWGEEFDRINAQSNEGLSTSDAQVKFHLLAWKYFPELKDTLPVIGLDDEGAEEFWEAIGKAILKLRQDALASCGLPALVDTDGAALMTQEATQ